MNHRKELLWSLWVKPRIQTLKLPEARKPSSLRLVELPKAKPLCNTLNPKQREREGERQTHKKRERDACMYVCMYIYMHAYMHVYIYTHVSIYICMYVYVYVCIYICIYCAQSINQYIYIHTYIFIYTPTPAPAPTLDKPLHPHRTLGNHSRTLEGAPNRSLRGASRNATKSHNP